MIEMLASMAAIWLLILVAPATPIGRFLRASLVERPAARLNRLSAGHVALIVLAGIVIGAIAWAGEGDGLRMLAMAAPEAATWLTSFEIAAYLDVAVAAFAAWSAARLRLPAALASLRGATPRRRRTARRDASARTPANDDEPADRRRCA
jgi:hypothetical protein